MLDSQELVKLEKMILDGETKLKKDISDLNQLRRKIRHPVRNYSLRSTKNGESVKLSELFAKYKKEDLLVIHNMGVQCPGCTMWADGFNGIYQHLEDRCIFIVTSPDSIEVQRKIREKRGWQFKMFSTSESEFTSEMGFMDSKNKRDPYMPGISTFRQQKDGEIYRVAKATICPRDVYNGAFHLLDLLDSSTGEWFPKLNYSQAGE